MKQKRANVGCRYGHFPSYLHRFNLRTQDNCSCGEKGDPMHYVTNCRFTLFWHFQTPTVPLKLQWLKNILTNNLSRTRLRFLMRFICDENSSGFCQYEATGVTLL
ncbi:hypothetical protein AVEN_110896-1 [Araneus ventricosus]|uniref:Uncharacterized protein n=1 Tax=Araneus ventricosus TaxID=182803 RepID=A0A4Y2M7S5_ARAVE|nr:hypothetical protein AVEN_110896-1 [Araneus ventricosus]